MKQTKRAVIYAKDVMLITGKGKRAAYRLLKRIRAKYDIGQGSFITVDHFCQYTGIKEQRINTFL